jgi:hypothetical protein
MFQVKIFMMSINFWDITPCSPLSVSRRFGGTYHLYLQGRRNRYSRKPASKQVASRMQNACHLLTYWFLAVLISSTLKMEAIYSSETSVATQQTTRSYIPEVDTLHNHRCENLKSYKDVYDDVGLYWMSYADIVVYCEEVQWSTLGQYKLILNSSVMWFG